MTESTTTHGNDDLPDYELASDEANQNLDALVRAVIAAIQGGEVERREAVEALSDGVREIAATEPDVNDVTVRDAIIRELNPAIVAAGWPRLEPFEF
jgi:hypothetical protein